MSDLGNLPNPYNHDIPKLSLETFSRMFQASPLMTIVMSVGHQRLIAVNDAFEQATGWTRSEVLGRTPDEIQLWKDLVQRDEFIAASSIGPVRNLELDLYMRD